MIVIGVDTHKRSHTLVALDAVTGATRGQLTIPASTDGTLEAMRFAAALDSERVWAVEDCRHVSGRLERELLASGDRVVRVKPGLTETSRRAARQPGKSDPIDATAIARAAPREGIDTLPVAFLDEQAHEIRVLNDYRRQLVSERVRLINRLRWHLVQIAPEVEAQIRPAGLLGPRVRAKVGRQLARLPHSPQLRVAKAILKRVCENYREENELLAELKALIDASLSPAAGRARVRAGDRRDHHRPHRRRQTLPDRRLFRPPHRHRPDPRQLRQHQPPPATPRRRPPLNHAIHIIALSRARTDTATRAYLDRRHAEGKTKKEALRCLKRHLARHIWRLLYTTETRPAPLASSLTIALEQQRPTNGVWGC
jgi:transposase